MRLGMMRELHVGQKFAGVVISYVLHRRIELMSANIIGNKAKSKTSLIRRRQGSA